MERRERQKEGGLVGEMEGAGDWERQRARETCQLQSGEAGFVPQLLRHAVSEQGQNLGQQLQGPLEHAHTLYSTGAQENISI